MKNKHNGRTFSNSAVGLKYQENDCLVTADMSCDEEVASLVPTGPEFTPGGSGICFQEKQFLRKAC